MIRVVLDGLVKRYERIAVVDLEPDRPLEIVPGEILTVLGPSGSGKTTLARIIAGLEEPESGALFFEDRPALLDPPEARPVGLVFQEDALWPHLTVAENLAHGIRPRGIGRKERRARVEEALAIARLDGLGQRRPEQLGPLQRRRVALARALIVEPRLLILDDPLGPLDPRDRDIFRDEIRRVHAEARMTTLVLTSQPSEALALADRIAVMDLGRIVQVGAPMEVYNRPASAFAAQFLGSVNLLPGHSETIDARGEVVVRTPLGRLIGRTDSLDLPAGTPVTVAIRPEALGFGSPVPSGSNRFNAALERQVFLGAFRRLHLRGPNDWPLSALALQGNSQALREGQGLTISVAPEFVIVLPSRFATAG